MTSVACHETTTDAYGVHRTHSGTHQEDSSKALKLFLAAFGALFVAGWLP